MDVQMRGRDPRNDVMVRKGLASPWTTICRLSHGMFDIERCAHTRAYVAAWCDSVKPRLATIESGRYSCAIHNGSSPQITNPSRLIIRADVHVIAHRDTRELVTMPRFEILGRGRYFNLQVTGIWRERKGARLGWCNGERRRFSGLDAAPGRFFGRAACDKCQDERCVPDERARQWWLARGQCIDGTITHSLEDTRVHGKTRRSRHDCAMATQRVPRQTSVGAFEFVENRRQSAQSIDGGEHADDLTIFDDHR